MYSFNSLPDVNANRFFQSISWQHRGVVGFLFLFMGLFGSGPAKAQSNAGTSRWLVVRDGEITLYTDAGESRARKVLEQVRGVSAVFRGSGRAPRESKVRILLFKSSNEFAEYRPTPISTGFYQTGADGDWIVFSTASGPRVVLHELTHWMLNRTLSNLPQWLEEGLAEFFSTTRVTENEVEFGIAIPELRSNLLSLPPMRAAELSAVRKSGIHYQEPEAATRFYATSWALVHMLYLDPRYASLMPEFMRQIDQAVKPVPELFAATFGIDLDRAIGDARERMTLPALPRFKFAHQTFDGGRDFDPQPVTAVAIAQLQATLFLDAGRREDAARKYRSIVSQTLMTTAAERQAALGFLELAHGNSQAAMARFRGALDAGTTDARTVFEYAMLLRDAGAANRAQVTELLQSAVRLDPAYAEALFLLGVRATDDGKYGEATKYLQRAVAAMPRQSPFWHALGYAEAKSGNMAKAREAALKSLRTASDAREEEMARALLEMPEPKAALRRVPEHTPRRVPEHKVSVPGSWSNPKGDAASTGVLEALDCSANDAPKLRIHTSRGVETFSMSNPRQIRIEGAGEGFAQWNCGKIEPRRVEVEYFQASRELTQVRFLP